MENKPHTFRKKEGEHMPEARILIVEDEVLVAEDLRQRIRRMGYDVPSTVNFAAEVLPRVRSDRPDLVLLDIHLDRGADGVALAESLRHELGIPVVFVTAYSDASTIERARKTEPFGFIVKPPKDSDLRAVIEVALYRAAMLRALQNSETRLRGLFQHMPAGALVFRRDEAGSFLLKEANPLAQELDQSDGGHPVGELLEEYWPGSIAAPLRRAVVRVGEEQREETLALSRLDEGKILSWRRYVVYPLPDNEVGILFSDITEEKRLEESLRLRAHALETLLKHHRCLGEVAAVASGPLPLEAKLRRIVSLAVEGTQFPESAEARITWYGQRVQTPHFAPTPWALSRPLLQSEIPVGRLEVCYSMESAPLYEGPFSREEVDLAEHVAEQISAAIAMDARFGREIRQRRLHEAAMEAQDTPLMVLDAEGKVIQVNSAWERWGNASREELLGDDAASLVRPGRSWTLLLSQAIATARKDASEVIAPPLRIVPLWNEGRELLGFLVSLLDPRKG